ncbi:hypothetical protein [Catenulispora pinisilvae]|uniref:hypothetical protein n=1 Tax=Catenulispora pinisilvae TaxID=2705253 RepID=UPI001891D964|nr:hypothetical protein [Catenulispora pinisilvae]
MSGKTWGIIGAVVVLAAAGTTTALYLNRDKAGDYKSLPGCDKLSAAVAGKPALKVGQNVTDAADIHGLHPAYSNIRCESFDDQTSVEVDLFGASNMSVLTTEKYPDKQVHDGTWRANDLFSHNNLTRLNANVAYGSADYAGITCTVEQVKRNAAVMLTVPMPKTTSASSAQRKAQCEQIAQTQMAKVMEAAL